MANRKRVAEPYKTPDERRIEDLTAILSEKLSLDAATAEIIAEAIQVLIQRELNEHTNDYNHETSGRWD